MASQHMFVNRESPASNVVEEEEHSHGCDDDSGRDHSEEEMDAMKDAAERKRKGEMVKETTLVGSPISAVETERQLKQEYEFPCPPDSTCYHCKDIVNDDDVHQCQSGHLACSTCFKYHESCLCGKAFNRIKNVAIRNAMTSLEVSFKFAKLGCAIMTIFKNVERLSEHEDICRFRSMACPMPGCNQAGVQSLLAQHLLAKHQISRLFDVTYCAAKFDLDSSNTLVMLTNKNTGGFHLLQHESTTLGDRFQVSCAKESHQGKSHKSNYRLNVHLNAGLTYTYSSVSTSDVQSGSGLLIPKQPDDGTLKKRCNVSMW